MLPSSFSSQFWCINRFCYTGDCSDSSGEGSLMHASHWTTQAAILTCVTSSSTWQCKVPFRVNTALTKYPHFRGTRSLWQFVRIWCLCQLLNHRKLLIPSYLLQNTFQSLLVDCFEYFRQLEVQCPFSFDCFYYSQNFLFLIELSDSVFVSLLLSQQFSAPQGKHAWSCHGYI